VPQITSNGPSVSVDLPIFDRNQGQIRIAKATRQQLFDEYVARVAEARSDVGRILDSIGIAREQLHEADASIPDLQKLVESMQQALKSRNADYKDYRDAYGVLATRKVEQSQLRQQLVELVVALEIATGRPLLNRSELPSP
jgi:cobalt-zinc-cadmium efflux system outer membrane protein